MHLSKAGTLDNRNRQLGVLPPNFCTGPGFSVMGLRDIGRRGSLIGVRGCVLLPSREVCTAKPMKALRVLVVEGDALIGLLLSELLAGMGHKVCAIAATEADAVSAAIRNRPDLMIVDAGLGRGSGISAVDEILRRGSLAHVFISGDAGMVRAHSAEIYARSSFGERPDFIGTGVAFSLTPSAALRYWNMARQRYCRRLAYIETPCASLPTRSPSQPRTAARKAEVLDSRKQLGERDGLAAGGNRIRTIGPA